MGYGWKSKPKFHPSEEFKHALAEELADRDEKVLALEERLQILEKIVTDTHLSSSLSNEIDELGK